MKEVSNGHLHTHTHTQTHTHTHTYTHAHTCTHMHTHTRTHAHTCTHAHAHVYTHAYAHYKSLCFVPISHIHIAVCLAHTPDTPLGLVCGRGGQVQLLTPLLTGGAHIDFRGKEGLTALHRAAIGGNDQAINVSVCAGSVYLPVHVFLSFALLPISSFSTFLLLFSCLPSLQPLPPYSTIPYTFVVTLSSSLPFPPPFTHLTSLSLGSPGATLLWCISQLP